MTSELGDHIEQAEVWYPGTLAGIADAWDEERKQRYALDRDIQNHADILLAASMKDADLSVDAAFRVGSIIEGRENICQPCGEVKTVRVRAVWRLNNDGKWEAKLQKV